MFNLDAQRKALQNKLDPQAPETPPAPAPAAPTGGYDYGKAQNSWFNAAPGTKIDDWVKANPTFTQGITSSNNGEFMNLPGGQSFDAVRDFGGANAPIWGSQDYNYQTGAKYTPQEAQAAEAQWAQKNGASGGGVGTSSGGMGGAAPATSDFQNQIRALLMQQMSGLSKPIDANDPTIQGEMQAQHATLDRNRQAQRASDAERMAFTGLNAGGAGSGAFDTANNAGFEQMGQAETGLQSQLFSRELTNRRQQMSQMLNMAMQSGDAESARALQMQIASMDAQLRKLGLDQQQSQFNDSYGLQREFGLAGLNKTATDNSTGV